MYREESGLIENVARMLWWRMIFPTLLLILICSIPGAIFALVN